MQFSCHIINPSQLSRRANPHTPPLPINLTLFKIDRESNPTIHAIIGNSPFRRRRRNRPENGQSQHGRYPVLVQYLDTLHTAVPTHHTTHQDPPLHSIIHCDLRIDYMRMNPLQKSRYIALVKKQARSICPSAQRHISRRRHIFRPRPLLLRREELSALRLDRLHIRCYQHIPQHGSDLQNILHRCNRAGGLCGTDDFGTLDIDQSHRNICFTEKLGNIRHTHQMRPELLYEPLYLTVIHTS